MLRVIFGSKWLTNYVILPCARLSVRLGDTSILGRLAFLPGKLAERILYWWDSRPTGWFEPKAPKDHG